MSAAPIDDPGRTRTHTGGDLLAPGTLVAGRYRILELVGAGGMGLVYRARDERLDVEVALKVLRPERAGQAPAEERFVRELVLARQVTHRNVVRIHDLGEEGGRAFLTMDFVAGRSLQEVLRRDGPLPVARAVAVARQLAAGLAAAHEEGVVHRDLKPANVLLDAAGRAYISDFGVARSVSGTALTRTGSVLGTLSYLSPEQARGEAVDGRSDLFSLGVVLYEMLAGELPFGGETAGEIVGQRLAGLPRTLREAGVRAPPGLERIVARCLARDPDDRYPDAAALEADLAALDAGGRIGGLGLPARWRRSTQRAVAWALGAAAVAAALVWVSIRWLPWPEPAVSGAAGGGPVHAVAVLPLADETGRADLSWASTGVADMLAAALAESPDLRVVEGSRTARTARDLGLEPGTAAGAEIRQVAELLDVDRLVTGTLRAAGERLRLDARVLAADRPGAAAETLRAESGPDGDLFTLVARVGEELRDRLAARAPPARPGPPSISPVALASYAHGVEALDRGDPAAAAAALEAAVEEDSAFGGAWLRLATAYEELGHRDRALDAVRNAVRRLGDGGGRLGLEARARAASLGGDPEAAREALATLVEAYPHDAGARLALAEAYGEEGRFDEARETLEALVAREPHHPRAWFLLGKFAILAGDGRRAADEYLVRALVIQNRLGNDRGRADALNALGVAHGALGEVDRALERYREAARLRREIGDRRGYAATLTNLGTLQFLEGDFETGRGRLAEALEILREIGDRQGLADLENELGILEEEQGRYEEALQHYRRGLQMRQELGRRRAVAESLNNVGFAYYLLGEYDNAGVYWQRALELYEESGNREGLVIAMQSLGLLDLVRGEWPAALERFVASLEASRELRMPQAEAVAHGHLGRLAQLQGRYGAALESYARALDVVRELDDPRGLAEFTLFQASVQLDLGRLDVAEETLGRAAEWLAQGGNQEQEAELERLRGELALARGRTDEARDFFERALDGASASGSFLAEHAARHGIARVHLAAGRTGDAVAILESVVEEASRAGCVTVLLPASVDLAAARVRNGDAAGADAVARRALRATLGTESYGEAWRLYRVLAAAHEARGEEEDAARVWALAAQEVERVRAGMDGDELRAFDGLPEVVEIDERAGSA